MGRITARTVFLLLALLATVVAAGPPGDARPVRGKALKREVVRLLVKARKDLRDRPRSVSRGRARRNRVEARRALRAARRRRWCVVVGAVARIDRIGRAKKRLRKVDRLLRRARVRRKCRPRVRRTRGSPVLVADATGGVHRSAAAAKGKEQGEGPPPVTGPPRRRGRRDRQIRETTGVHGSSLGHAAGAGDPAGVFHKVGLRNPGSTVTPAEPSVALSGRVAVMTGNSWLATSTDGGRTFKYRNHSADVFGASVPGGGPDGDQIVQYDPVIDRFVWVIQWNCDVAGTAADCKTAVNAENRYRIALATPSDIIKHDGKAKAWRFFDVTSDDFRQSDHWMDFPDVAVGRNAIYLTFNVFRTGKDASCTPANSVCPRHRRAIWTRIMNGDLRRAVDSGGRPELAYVALDRYLLRPVQNTSSDGWAVHSLNSSTLELYHWPEGSGSLPAPREIGHTRSADSGCSVTGPDKVKLFSDDCDEPYNRVGGAAMDGRGDIWVAWGAGRRIKGAKEDSWKQPHVDIVEIGRDHKLKDERDIYNSGYAYSVPALSSSYGSGDVAVSYISGGGDRHPGWGVGYVSDRKSVVRIAGGSHGRTRLGDYVTVRPAANVRAPDLMVGSGYVIADASGGGQFEQPWFAIFGRSSDPPPPTFRLDTTLTATCPGVVTPGGIATVTARLSPSLSGERVAVRFTPPGGVPSTVVRTTDDNGVVNASMAASVSGTWQVDVSYSGNEFYNGSSARCAYPVGTPTGKTPHSLTLNCPSGSQIESTNFHFDGMLNPPVAGASVWIEFDKSGSEDFFARVVPTNAVDGSYSLDLRPWPDSLGTWTAQAYYPGDASNEVAFSRPCSFTVVAMPR